MNATCSPRDGAISLTGVSKRFKLYRSSFHRLTDIVLRRQSHRDRWAVRGITMEIGAGEAIGLLGSNGAGKSTLLHLIAGTRTATMGTVRVGGKIASLLELGVGFHAEWTGRRNVQFYLRLCGIEPPRMAPLERDIEDFADIGDYFDQPLRACSTGMMMRVAFAAAAFVDADILIIDEALAVGDVVFQHKCFQHIERLKARGVTILLVTHQPALITQICSRALVLQKGEVVFDGEPREAAERYIALSSINTAGQTGLGVEKAADTAETRFGSGAATLTAIAVSPPGLGGECYASGEVIAITLSTQFKEYVENPDFGFSIKSLEGIVIYTTSSALLGLNIGAQQKGDHLTLALECPLNMPTGTVFLDFSVFSQSVHGIQIFDARLSAVRLDIEGSGSFFGLIDAGASMRPVAPEQAIGGAGTQT